MTNSNRHPRLATQSRVRANERVAREFGFGRCLLLALLAGSGAVVLGAGVEAQASAGPRVLRAPLRWIATEAAFMTREFAVATNRYMIGADAGRIRSGDGQLLVTTSKLHWKRAVELRLTGWAAIRVMFAADWPFEDAAAAGRTFEAIGLDHGQENSVANQCPPHFRVERFALTGARALDRAWPLLHNEQVHFSCGDGSDGWNW